MDQVPEVGLDPSSGDERFAANVRLLREQRGWSQGELARRVVAAGLPAFHQTTISRIEKGERPVRIGEAHAIALTLGTNVPAMLEAPGVSTADVEVLEAIGRLMDAGRTMSEQAIRIGALRQELREALKRHKDSISPKTRTKALTAISGTGGRAEGMLVRHLIEARDVPSGKHHEAS